MTNYQNQFSYRLKMLNKLKLFSVLSFAAILLVGCNATMKERVLDSSSDSATAVQLRAMQSRSFDTVDKQKTLRTVIATLQDLGFVVDKADHELGSVSATKLSGYALRLTVSVRAGSSGKNTIVRANAQFNTQPVDDPKPYQDFFSSLQKAMFLTANQVE